MNLPPFAGIILRHGSHFLFIQREERAKHWPLYWAFPGGKIEKNEAPLEAAIREVQEEIGIKIAEKDIVGSISVRGHYVEGTRENILYLVDSWEGMPENLEPKNHREIRWCTLDDLPYPIVPHIYGGFLALLKGEEIFEYDSLV